MSFGVLTLTSHIFEALQVQGHILAHWKALRFGKDDSRRQSCSIILNIRQDVLKSGNMLHKWGFVDSQFGTTVRCQV